MSTGLVFDIDSFAVHDGPGIRLAAYLKGCPLSCEWCHSPESQSFEPELIYIQNKCTICGTCAAVCPEHVHSMDAGEHTLNRESCTACGICADACPTSALAIKGYTIDASVVIEKAIRMKPFFKHSRGGITITGGEVTAQPKFAMEILTGCKGEGIHTAIETCGACAWETLEPIAELCDLIMYDIKLADSRDHERWTGAGNDNILENLCRLSAEKIRIRVPLIPGITDTEANLTAVGKLASASGITDVEHLPYNESSQAKYEWLGREITLEV
ncbi:MAG: glycyl-radical enzyme activating protein [Spirochaetales bacterium]|nr:glycyl-radical enzyme activating protein [Spirochaetales bacterium]